MVLLQFHLDVTEFTDAFWWIDSPQVPTLYASGPTIVDARRLAMDKLDAAGLDTAEIHYEIVDADNSVKSASVRPTTLGRRWRRSTGHDPEQ